MKSALSPHYLLRVYAAGYFPMAHPEEGNEIGWYAPDPRAILPLESFHIPKSLARVVRSERFEIRFDTAFADVISACAEWSAERDSTWISPEIMQAYCGLHQAGFAHSVESWRENRLVGGLYGVALGGAFFGESMFHRERDASKVALVTLVERLRKGKFSLLDTQFMTSHLRQFGAFEIPRSEYEMRLTEALQRATTWQTD
ncbi:leucyl/phenylalanyl-tRNA--protein transferase [soil metagenome]